MSVASSRSIASSASDTLPWSEEERASIKWAPIPQTMSTTRRGLVAVSIGNQLLVFGGYNHGGYLSTAEMFDTETWTKLPSMPTPRGYFAAVAVDNQVYVIGGSNLNTMDMLDVTKQKWTSCPPMSTQRYGHAAVAVQNNIIVMGGRNSGYLKTAEIYSVVTKKWTNLPPMSKARYYCSAAVVDDNVYVFGGDGGGGQETAEMFNTITQQWTTLPSIPFTHRYGAAVAIGKTVVLVGVNRADLFDTESQMWHKLPPMATNRKWCAAASIQNQQVVVVVGGSDGSTNLPTAERLVFPHSLLSQTPTPPDIPLLPFVLGKRQRAAALREWLNKAAATRKEYLDKVRATKQNLQASFTNKLDALEKQLQALLSKKENTNEERGRLLASLETDANEWIKALDEQIVDAQEMLADIVASLNRSDKEATAAVTTTAKTEDHHVISVGDHLAFCPMTKQVMTDPVVAADGETYERAAIEQHMARVPNGQNVLSPVTGNVLSHCMLTPNVSIQKLVRSYNLEQQNKTQG